MTENTAVYGVRSDVHGRIGLAQRQLDTIKKQHMLGLFDLGDVECSYVSRKNPLRKGQTAQESTSNAIIRNALEKGELTLNGRKAINATLISAQETRDHLASIKGLNYRGIAGNAEDSWLAIFEQIASSGELSKLKELFQGYDHIREAKTEVTIDGQLYDPAVNPGIRPSSGVIYLPWKASLESVDAAIQKLDHLDLAKIVVLSHDYLTEGSIAPEWREEIKPMQNEEQVVMVLDALSKRDCIIEGYYGHIGFRYGDSQTTFQHNGKTITAYHADEKDGQLLEVRL